VPHKRNGSQAGLAADERRCPRCKEVKPIGGFDRRSANDPRPRPYCRPCFRDYQRERYLSVDKVRAINAARLVFTVGPLDKVNGMACMDCGAPLRPGERVYGDAALRHEDCPR
jgi:hypothetical protein